MGRVPNLRANRNKSRASCVENEHIVDVYW